MQLLTAGSAACFADLVTFPLDTVKVRQQIQSNVAFSQVELRSFLYTFYLKYCPGS